MPPQRQELVAELLRSHWPIPDSDFVLLTARDRDGQTVTLKGAAKQERLHTNHAYRFFGSGWSSHPTYGQQFAFTDFVEHEPHSRRAIIAYLTKLQGIGSAAAQCLCDLYGDRAIGLLRQDPSTVAAEVRARNPRLRLTEEIAVEASRVLKKTAALEDARLELIDLFDKRGFPGTVVEICIKFWGPAAARRIRRDPFILLTRKVPGAGFLRVDRMYQELGLPLERNKRVVYLIWHTISRDSNGSTWVHISRLKEKVADCLTGVNFPRAMAIGRRAGVLVEANDRGDLRPSDCRDPYVKFEWISRGDWSRQETGIAEDVLRLIGEKDQ